MVHKQFYEHWNKEEKNIHTYKYKHLQIKEALRKKIKMGICKKNMCFLNCQWFNCNGQFKILVFISSYIARGWCRFTDTS